MGMADDGVGRNAVTLTLSTAGFCHMLARIRFAAGSATSGISEPVNCAGPTRRWRGTQGQGQLHDLARFLRRPGLTQVARRRLA